MITFIAKQFGLSKGVIWVVLGIAVLALVSLAFALIAASQDKRVSEGVERGAATERAATAAVQGKRAETANKAEAELADPEKRRAICSKYSRTPDHCE